MCWSSVSFISFRGICKEAPVSFWNGNRISKAWHEKQQKVPTFQAKDSSHKESQFRFFPWGKLQSRQESKTPIMKIKWGITDLAENAGNTLSHCTPIPSASRTMSWCLITCKEDRVSSLMVIYFLSLMPVLLNKLT